MHYLLEFHFSNTELTQELVTLLRHSFETGRFLLQSQISSKTDKAILPIWMKILKENDFFQYLIQF